MICLLGPVGMTLAGRPVRFARRQERALVAILALRPGRMVTIDRLSDLLWGADPPGRPRLGVQATVSHVRAAVRAVDPRATAMVVSRGGAYLLDVDPMDVDLHRLRTVAGQAVGLAPRRRAEVLTRARDLWRGDVATDTFDDEQRARLCPDAGELRRSVEEDLIEARLQLGEYRWAAGAARSLLAEQPGRERAVGLLMLALYRGGETIGALEVFGDHARARRAQFGLDPGPRLRDLEIAILRDDPVLANPPSVH